MYKFIEHDRRMAAARNQKKCQLAHESLMQNVLILEKREKTLARAREVNSNASSAEELRSSRFAFKSAEADVKTWYELLTLSLQAHTIACENAGETPYTQQHQPVNLHNSAEKMEVIDGAKGATAGVDLNESSMCEPEMHKSFNRFFSDVMSDLTRKNDIEKSPPKG